MKICNQSGLKWFWRHISLALPLSFLLLLFFFCIRDGPLSLNYYYWYLQLLTYVKAATVPFLRCEMYTLLLFPSR